jgi:hypothetical protein
MANTNPLAKIIAKAWKDPAFKKKLFADPKAALKEMGIDIPKNVTVKIVEDTPKSLTVVLPMAPTQVNEMNDNELEKLAAAGCEAGTVVFSTKPECGM